MAAGGPVIIIFHTRTESARLYAGFVAQALRAEVASDVASADQGLVGDFEPLAKDLPLDPRSRTLPRAA